MLGNGTQHEVSPIVQHKPLPLEPPQPFLRQVLPTEAWARAGSPRSIALGLTMTSPYEPMHSLHLRPPTLDNIASYDISPTIAVKSSLDDISSTLHSASTRGEDTLFAPTALRVDPSGSHHGNAAPAACTGEEALTTKGGSAGKFWHSCEAEMEEKKQEAVF